jgi:hypothetical protein
MSVQIVMDHTGDGYQDDGFYKGVWIRCFMPGSMT